MERMIKLHIWGTEEIKEVTLQEAEKILVDTDNDPFGGFVLDARTHEIIAKIGPDTQEIIIVPELLIGGG